MPTDTAARAAPDPKQAIVDSWDARAALWDSWTPIVDAWFGPATSLLLRDLRIRPGDRVLELGAGTGGLTKELARSVGPGGRVLATDSGAEMVRRAAQNLRALGFSNFETRVMDAERPEVADASMDVVACRQAFMFLPQPALALERIARILRPGGRLGLTVFTGPERNAFLSTPGRILTRWAHPEGPPAPDPRAPGPFSLSAPGQLEGLLARAGFERTTAQAVPCPLRMPSLPELMRFYREILGEAAKGLPASVEARAWAEVESESAAFLAPGSAGAPCEILVAGGQRPGAGSG